ncbi:MAG: hypothetical protein LUQ62_04930 [Methanomicrobiales archaeon]|nr:hypothetical protein [Methanomicrobiales archaeon]
MRASAFISASAGILLVLLLLSSGCGQRPTTAKNTSFQPFWDTTVTTAGTPVPTTPDVGVVVEATPFPVETVATTPMMTSRPSPWETTDQTVYMEIYNREIPFKYNITAVEYRLENPPLLIDFNIKTVNLTRTGVARDPTCTPTETNLCLRTVTITYPDPAAWFTITVTNLDTKQVYARNGYARDYDVDMDKQVVIRSPGNYHIEMAGSIHISAVVRMRVPG